MSLTVLAGLSLVLVVRPFPTAKAVTPGQNGRIVFVSNIDRLATDLYTMNPDGTGITRITNDPLPPPEVSLQYFDPVWSPDGSKIAVMRNNGTKAELLFMNGDGTGVTAINLAVENLSWSPNGTQLIFSALRYNQTTDYHNIQRININGTGLTSLTTTDTQDHEPAWSPDGTKIAFVRNGQLAIMHSDGTNVVLPQPGITGIANPAWSPDGTKIVFERYGLAGLKMVNADGSNLVTLLSDRIDDISQAAWAPDGQRLIVNSGPSLWMIKPDASCAIKLLQPPVDRLAYMSDWQRTAAPTSFSLPTDACVTTKRGVNATITVPITRSGFTGPVTLSVSGLPAGATGTFSPNPATGATSTLTITSTECQPITPEGGYALTVTGVGGGLTRKSLAGVRLIDGAPRVTTAPTSTIVAGSTMGTTTVPVRTNWLACDSEYIDQYRLERYTTSWADLGVPALATSKTESLKFLTSYRYRATAEDHNLNWAPLSYGPTFQPRITQQSSTSITFGGSWSTTTYASYSGGTSKNAKVAGAWASYTFTGSSIAWIGATSTSRGSAKVYIDGVYKATVSTYSATTAYRRILYAFNWSSQGTHTIKIVVVGTSGHPRVDLDAFVRLYRV